MGNRRTAGTEEVEGKEVVLTKSQPSVLVKVDSKGAKSYEVKAYADTMEDALAQALMAAGRLDSVFGLAGEKRDNGERPATGRFA